MNYENIERIMSKRLFMKIRKNKYYRGLYGLKKDGNTKISGFWSMWLFFDSAISDKKLNQYFEQANMLVSGEVLGYNEIIKCYGIKVLVLS